VFRNKNFFYLWSGRLISNAGDSLYYIVLSWYIVELTNQSKWVGFLNFSIFLPSTFSFVFGPLIDKANSKKLLILCEVGQLLSISVIAGFIYFHNSNPLWICIFTFLASIFGMNTYTIQDILVPKIVPRSQLANAQQYMSMAYNGSEYLFNAISGFLINVFSTFFLIVVNIVTFIASIFSFSNIHLPKKQVVPEFNNFGGEGEKKWAFLQGFSIIYRNKPVLLMVICSAVLNFLFGGLNVYLVLIAKQQNSAVLFGFTTAALAVGTLLGTTLLSSLLLKRMRHGSAHVISTVCFGIAICISAVFANSEFISLCLGVAALFLGVTHVTGKPYYQVLVDGKDLGKVMSANYSISVGALPFGSLLFGFWGSALSSTHFLLLFGGTYLVVGLLYLGNKTIMNFSLAED